MVHCGICDLCIVGFVRQVWMLTPTVQCAMMILHVDVMACMDARRRVLISAISVRNPAFEKQLNSRWNEHCNTHVSLVIVENFRRNTSLYVVAVASVHHRNFKLSHGSNKFTRPTAVIVKSFRFACSLLVQWPSHHNNVPCVRDVFSAKFTKCFFNPAFYDTSFVLLLSCSRTW